MTYDQADNILNNLPPGSPKELPPLTAGGVVNPTIIGRLKRDLTILTKLARLKKREREDLGGAVDLTSGDVGNELKFTLDDDGAPTKVIVKETKELHETIAELMILANTSVAKRIYDTFADSALLRIHRPVQDEQLNELREVLQGANIKFHGNDKKGLAQTLMDVRKSKQSNVFKSLVQSIATRKFFF